MMEPSARPIAADEDDLGLDLDAFGLVLEEPEQPALDAGSCLFLLLIVLLPLLARTPL